MTTNARDEKWSKWKMHDGKSVPIDDYTDFEYRMRCGTENTAYGRASDYHTAFIHAGGNSDIIAYRYKIKEPESDMHPDLEWLATNVSEWGGDTFYTRVFLDGSGDPDYCSNSCGSIIGRPSFTNSQWLQARKDLGLIMSDEEEEMGAEAWNGYVDADDQPDNVNKPKNCQLREGYEVYDLRQDLAAKAANGGATYDQYSDWDRAIEYIVRMWGKNRLEDAKKGYWYLGKLIEKLEAQGE